MAAVSVLYISDEIVGPHLQLLRRICEPQSKSRPHVTVRFFKDLSVPDAYKSAQIGNIDLIEPGAFGFDAPKGANRTVYIRCKSDDLTPLEFKPDFPTSEFHITVYDGPSLHFAKQLLAVLQSFKWRFRVRLPEGTHLTLLQLNPRKRRRSKGRPVKPLDASVQAQATFKIATGKELSEVDLEGLSFKQRLSLCKKVCKHLQAATASFQHVSADPRQRFSIPEHEEPEVHLTPPELAQEIAEYAVTLLKPDSQIDFGDPAVGTGAFYSALLQVVDIRRIHSAVGIDISARQVAAATSRWSHKGMKVIQRDYLHMEQLPSRNLILANPPFLRHQEIPDELKISLRQRASVRLGKAINGRAGQYVYFLILSHDWMMPGGVAAWVVPAEFMKASYGDAVRDYLTNKVQLVRIHQFDFGEPQFENAKATPAIVVFRNRPPVAGLTAIVSSGGTLAAPTTSESIDVAELRTSHRWSIPMRKYTPARASDISIGDVFHVRRGIATGANDFFVLERTQAKELGLPAIALKPLLPKARTLKSDIIEREEDGYPHVANQLTLLDCDLAEGDIRRKHPKLMAYLESGKILGILERNLVSSRRPWYKQERREPPMFLCTYMGRGKSKGIGQEPLRFIWNKSDAVATNTYLLLYPRPELTHLIKLPHLAAEIFESLQRTAKASLEEWSRIHAGGLHKIEPSELLRVRFVSPPEWLKEVLLPHLQLAAL